MPNWQNPGVRHDPRQSRFEKPFLSEADESKDGSGDKLMPSRKTCLVIEKTRECKIFSKQPTREDVS